MIPLEEAKQFVLDGCEREAPARLSLRDALGCVTATPVIAEEAVPPFENSSMDGYAVRAADTEDVPVRLQVVGELPAGIAPSRVIGPGEAIRIMTGAPLPGGADAVVNVEATDQIDNDVVINVTAQLGQFVRRAGSDVLAGSTVLGAATTLSAAHLGVLASIGEQTVEVYPRLRVGILCTGDELVSDGSPLAPGQIREANKDMLCALVEQANAIPIDLGIASDGEQSLATRLQQGCATCDALITSGGVSMGEYDLVKVVLEKLGTMRWMQIAIQPAKPFAFGRIGDNERTIPVFGLPGNPVSSFVSFELLARPALRKMMGHTNVERPVIRAIADDGLSRRAGDGKVQWQRVHGEFREDGRFHVNATGEQGSHQLANSAAANALARVPDSDGIEAGGELDVLLLI